MGALDGASLCSLLFSLIFSCSPLPASTTTTLSSSAVVCLFLRPQFSSSSPTPSSLPMCCPCPFLPSLPSLLNSSLTCSLLSRGEHSLSWCTMRSSTLRINSAKCILVSLFFAACAHFAHWAFKVARFYLVILSISLPLAGFSGSKSSGSTSLGIILLRASRMSRRNSASTWPSHVTRTTLPASLPCLLYALTIRASPPASGRLGPSSVF